MFITKRSEIFNNLLLVFLTALIFHFCFSWIGFNPTDEGFVLSESKRILLGQIPHKDFISIRPTGSYYFHTLDMLLGGQAVFWFSRGIAWLELALISYFWTRILLKRDFLKQAHKYWYPLFIISYIICVHDSPIMAWTTIDGIFFASLGYFLINEAPRAEARSFLAGNNQKNDVAIYLGFVLIGFSALCKQSFLPLLIFVPFLTTIKQAPWKKFIIWICELTPIIVYFTFLMLNNALSDFFIQISSRSEIISVGVIAYLKNYYFYLGSISVLIYKLVGRRFPIFLRLNAVILVAISIGIIYSLSVQDFYLYSFSFAIFGAACMFFILENKFRTPQVLFAILIAWCASISLGYNSPAYLGGILIVLIFLDIYLNTSQKVFKSILLYVTVPICLVTFFYIRTHHIYRDIEAQKLTMNLEYVLPGGKYIKTNPRTYNYLNSLKTTIDQYSNLHKSYILLPNFSAYWVANNLHSQIPIDWPSHYELPSEQLVKQVTDSMDKNRKDRVVIVAKMDISTYAINSDKQQEEVLVEYVRKNFHKVSEDQFFEVYQ